MSNEQRVATPRRTAPGRRANSLVALGERIRLHQILGLVADTVLSVGSCPPDPRLAPEMMILVDAHIAFRCALEFHAGRSRRDLVDVERAGLLGRELPQPGTQIGGLRDVADDG